MVPFFNLFLPPMLAHLAAAMTQASLLLLIPFLGAMTFVWMERKISARIQDRLGPTRTGGRFGWLQLLADGIKLICKEDVTPRDADPLLFRLAPYISFTAAYTALVALPFAEGWVVLRLEYSLFFILALLGMGVFGLVLAGYSSGSKWSLFGAMREAAQMVSYEVPLGLCALAPVIVVGSMDLTTIAEYQAGAAHRWLIFANPFLFILFWVYFTCGVASCSRAPFDLAEAESELVAGFHTEYSGFRWLAFFMGEYGNMFTVSALAAILFLGGWHGPLPITVWLGLHDSAGPFWGWLGRLLGLTNLIVKAFLGVTVMIWVRWTLPRLRIDQVITVCLKYCLPIAAAMLVGVTAWCLARPDPRVPPSPATMETTTRGEVEGLRR